MENVTTYCQADYLLSGKLLTVKVEGRYTWRVKLPTVRQTTYCQSLGPLHMESLTTCCQEGYLLSGRLTAVVRDASKRSILCTQKSPHTCTKFPHILTNLEKCNMVRDLSRSVSFLKSVGVPLVQENCVAGTK